SVSVPLGGVAAKLNSVRNKPALARANAAKTRGLKIAVSDVDFFFMSHGSGLSVSDYRGRVTSDTDVGQLLFAGDGANWMSFFGNSVRITKL
ncbi:MAG TPA: hypothetical protein VF751_10410, partial [Chthoniobacterales bacterium]